MLSAALEPSRSAVVEACAGSGKTWLLAARIVRLLLAGAAPGDILAITFTRKAAREIEERVANWLELLATGTPAQIEAFLIERGATPDAVCVRTARGLYERVLTAQPGLTVNTFHGWFLQLLDAAPLSANLAGLQLEETDSRQFGRLWQSFAARLGDAPDGDVAKAFLGLLDVAGLDATRRLIRRAFERRSEWLSLGGEPAEVIARLQAQLGAGEPGTALSGFFVPGWTTDFHAYLGFLEASTLKGDATAATVLRTLLDGEGRDAAGAFETVRPVFLTQSFDVRLKNPSKALDARYTPTGAARFLELHARLGARVQACHEALTAESILAFNRDACTVFAAFLAHVEAFKRARRQIDFTDAEWIVAELLRDETTAAFLQARLDTRYKHVLLDEFQDTNPLQWQILRAWFDAYSDAARPSVFLVGDPKQSIYRFRRAEPRLFGVAADFLERGFGALRCTQDVTRRNAQAVIDVVNALFLEVPEFAPFRPQSSLAGELPGWVELLPLCAAGEAVAAPERSGLRNPLYEPVVEAEDVRRRTEAEQLARRLAAMTGGGGEAWLIDERTPEGLVRRPARYGDVMVLVRSRTHLACYERALAAAGIPFDAGSRGGLLERLEVRDIVALLEFLSTPVDDLKLAHVLRTPLFACRDEDLMRLATACAEAGRGVWWTRLSALSEDSGLSPPLARAAGLLNAWLALAPVLPVHDLLDRIYHEGAVLARYRRAAPPSAAASVESNLRAVLRLSLDLDGGRYPSLPRFVDALRDLRDADASDAPDEGAIDTGAADAGRVRILTIHGAKGLEAPIVWLLGAHEAARRADAWDVLVDWPPEEAAPCHFSFVGRKETRGAARERLFQREVEAAQREELNLLYVAVTRARQVLIASGIDNARAGEKTAYRLLEAALCQLGQTGSLSHGAGLPRGPAADVPATGRAFDDTPVAPVGERRLPPSGAERFGILLHALLERRTQAAGEGDAWWAGLGFSEAEYRAALPVAERLLAAPALQRFFDPAQYRRAWNEVELAGEGVLLRVDRLVDTEEGVWVIDYKSSAAQTSRLGEYRAQLARYCRVVRGIFAERPVRGVLVFADATQIELVPEVE